MILDHQVIDISGCNLDNLEQDVSECNLDNLELDLSSSSDRGTKGKRETFELLRSS